MKKSIFITVVLFAFTSITNQLVAQEAAKTSGYDLKKAVKCRVSQTDNGCSIVFESSPPSSASGTAKSKKGYDHYMAKSSFSVSASDNSVSEIVSPRDPASGLPTGKRMHKPVSVSSSASSGTSSDAMAVSGSGGGSGKVNVQDLSFSKVNVQDISFTKRCGGKTTKISCDGGECEIPIEDCPNGDCAITADWSWGMSQGSSKRCSVDFLLKIEDGVCTAMAINEKGLPGEKKPNKSTTNNPK
jgi:hypothetical protein